MTSGVSPAPEPSATRSATRRIDTGSPEHTLKTSQRPDGASTAACSAAMLAAATSETFTKSRTWGPWSNTCGAYPRSTEERDMAATPEYGVSRGMPGP